MVKGSPILVLFDVIVILVLYLTLKRVQKRNSVFKKTRAWGSFMLFATVCLFSFYDTDWFHYQEILEQFKDTRFIEYGVNTHLEQGYIDIAKIVNYDYILFRLVVWVGALFIFCITANRFNLRLDTSLFCLLPFIIFFTYGRVTLTMAIAFFLFSYIVKPTKHTKWIIIIVASLLIWYTTSTLHKSSIILIPALILSILPLRKGSLKSIAILFVLTIVLMEVILSHYLLYTDEISTIYIEKYTVGERANRGIGGIVNRVISSVPFYAVFFYILRSIKRNVYREWPYYIKTFANATLWIVLLASVFLLRNDELLYYRFLYFAMIPGAITLSYAYYSNSEVKVLNCLQNVCLLALFYTLIYRFYLSLF